MIKSDKNKMPDLYRFGQEVLRRNRKQHDTPQGSIGNVFGVHQSRISQLERGKLMPRDLRDVNRLGKIYRLNNEQLDTWKSILGFVERECKCCDSLLLAYQRAPQRVYEAKLEGNPKYAARLANDFADELEKLIALDDCVHINSELRSIYARVRLHQIIALIEISMPSNVLPRTLGFCRETVKIAEELGDSDLLASAYHRTGTAYYIAEDYEEAIKYIKKSFVKMRNIDERIWASRTLLVSCAFLGRQSEFEIAEREVRGLIEAKEYAKKEVVCFVMEGIGRGHSLFGNKSQCFSAFEGSSSVMGQMSAQQEHVPFRATQLLRSELEAMNRFRMKGGASLAARVDETLVVARENGYIKHLMQIKDEYGRIN